MRLLGPRLAKERKGVLGSVDRARRVSASLSFKTAVKAGAALDRLSGWAALAVLATAIGVLALWNLFPAFSFALLRDDWIVMAPGAAAGFGLLAAALLFYVRRPPVTREAQRIVAATLSGAVLLGLFLPPWGAAVESPFTRAALAGLATALLARCAVGKARGRTGDVLGAAVLFLIAAFVYFLICYCHGVRFVPPGEIPCPRLLSVVSTVLLASGFLGSLGPDRFPGRLFIGTSLRSVLLRKLFPLAVGVVLVFVCVRGSMLAFLSGPAAAFWTLLVWSLIVVFIILQSSLVVGGELGKALQESEQNYTQLVQGLKDHAVFLLNPKGEVLVWNAGAELMTGYTAAEVLGTSVSRLMASGEAGLNLESALQTVHATGVFRGEGTAVRSDGRRFWAEMSLSRLVSGKGRLLGVSVILRDASTRKQAEQTMAQSLLEKEVLLKEIHHRVKNNLQVIVSLLRLQADTVGDPKIAAFFMDSQERVRAMAMVHEYLYKSDDFARINFPNYVAGLIRNLLRVYGSASGGPVPRVEIEDIELGLDAAIPCGLLLTELVSNAVKYAYPPGTGGTIDIKFKTQRDGRFELSVADRGAGFPAEFNWKESNTLGLRLVRLLSEQLQGTLSLESVGGVRASVTFRWPPA